MTAHQQAKIVPDYSFPLADRTTRTTAPPGARMMARSTIDRPAVNSPREEPTHRRRYDRKTRLFDLAREPLAQHGGPDCSRG